MIHAFNAQGHTIVPSYSIHLRTNIYILEIYIMFDYERFSLPEIIKISKHTHTLRHAQASYIVISWFDDVHFTVRSSYYTYRIDLYIYMCVGWYTINRHWKQTFYIKYVECSKAKHTHIYIIYIEIIRFKHQLRCNYARWH